MNIIFLSNKKEISKTVRLHAGVMVVVVVALLSLPLFTGFAGYKHALNADAGEDVVTVGLKSQVQSDWQEALTHHENEIEKVKEDAKNQFKALTVRMAELQARLTRLDALGERLVDAADLRGEEFNFSQEMPPLGGPHDHLQNYAELDFIQELDRLANQIEVREEQLGVLDSVLANRKIEEEVFLAGRPIRKGWMSSRFGRRTDPFTGQLAWHKGIDFAGKEGSDIVSVASGVVTWSGKRSGYGYLVEINHGKGYITRYGHCKKMLVKAGDIVRKGQVIALMGSTGRSTGPHVHFEVIKDGKQVDPSKYVRRESL